MTCCGGIRSRAIASPPAAGAASAARPGAGGSPGDVALSYRDRARILVRGPATGRAYVFAGGAPTLVASRDAGPLLATRAFARAQ